MEESSEYGVKHRQAKSAKGKHKEHMHHNIQQGSNELRMLLIES